jgi:hypothetical protein
VIPVPAASTLLTVVSPIISAVPAPTIAPRVPFCCPVLVLGVVSSTCTVATEASVCVGGVTKICVSASLSPVSSLMCRLFKLGLIVQRVPQSTSHNLPASPLFLAWSNTRRSERKSLIRRIWDSGAIVFLLDVHKHHFIRSSVKHLAESPALPFLTRIIHSHSYTISCRLHILKRLIPHIIFPTMRPKIPHMRPPTNPHRSRIPQPHSLAPRLPLPSLGGTHSLRRCSPVLPCILKYSTPNAHLNPAPWEALCIPFGRHSVKSLELA